MNACGSVNQVSVFLLPVLIPDIVVGCFHHLQPFTSGSIAATFEYPLLLFNPNMAARHSNPLLPFHGDIAAPIVDPLPQLNPDMAA